MPPIWCLRGQARNAFCSVRPPGHHAEHSRAMGFCFFNNVAVGAAHALEQHGLERVAVVDFDVHHGNGTEDIFRDDPRVLMVSTFQHPFYPYSGIEGRSERMVNIPLPAYTRRPGLPRGGAELVAAGARAFPAADGVHLRRVRRASRGRHGLAGPGRGRLRVGYGAAQDGRGPARPGAHRLGAGRRVRAQRAGPQRGRALAVLADLGGLDAPERDGRASGLGVRATATGRRPLAIRSPPGRVGSERAAIVIPLRESALPEHEQGRGDPPVFAQQDVVGAAGRRWCP